jgi:hypothetical protein
MTAAEIHTRVAENSRLPGQIVTSASVERLPMLNRAFISSRMALLL